MSTVSDIQPQNQLSKFIGTGEFLFAEGFLTATAALGAPFIDFGNVTGVQYQTNSESKVILSSRRGLREEGPARITLLRFGYQLKLNEFRSDIVKYLTAGEPLSNYTQSAQSVAATQLPSSPVKDRWYFFTIAGVEYRNITAAAFTPASGSLTEDVNYKVDYENGRYRWLTTPVSMTSITITAPAILVTDALTLARQTPKVTPIRRGIGRLNMYDRINAVQNSVYEHKDFYCELMQTGGPNIDGQNEAEITIDVKVLTPAGEIRVREQPIFVA